jgi:opacity protein-like surface antigen
MAKILVGSLIVSGALAAPRAASAQPPIPADEPKTGVPEQPMFPQSTTVVEDQPGEFSYAWREPRLFTDIGVGITLGGGISGFTDSTMRNTLSSSVSGLWDARVAIGTHVPISLEVGYIGTAANINTFAGTANGTLIGTTVEGALRWNILPHYMVNPYIFGGVGWQRYDITNMQVATADSGISKNENRAEFPVGAGASYRDLSGWMIDVRGTFRAVPDSNLVFDQTRGTFAQAHWWEASAALGYEF